MNTSVSADTAEFVIPASLETPVLNAALRLDAPINLARAYDVMEEEGLEGIVVGDPLNVFHFTGYWPQIAKTKLGQPPTTFALLVRDRTMSRGLVTSKFIYYYTFSDAGLQRPYEVYLFGEAGDAGPDVTETAAKPTLDFPDRGKAPLTNVEIRRREGLNAALTQRHVRSDAGAALVDAMRDLGMWRGKVAFDTNVIAAVCEHHRHPGKMVPADNILRNIRLIKSPLEIQLMRRASWSNVEAVRATAKLIRAGVSYADLRRAYFREAMARENFPVFMTIDRVSAELADLKITDGQVFFIDGVSNYQNYHGDFARTVYVGEPPPSMKLAAEAVAFGWQEIRGRLRPGMRYSEIYTLGNEAVRKAGYDVSIGFGPHSVGLSHTDEPGRNAGGFYVKDNLVLQPNMIISVDCPVVDTGLGGSAHIEDLMLITADGAVPIHEMDDPIIIV